MVDWTLNSELDFESYEIFMSNKHVDEQSIGIINDKSINHLSISEFDPTIKNNYTVTDFYFCSILPNFQHSTSNNIDIHFKIYKTNEFIDNNNIEISNIQNTLNMIHNQQIIGSSFEYAPYNLYNWWFTTPKITGEFYEK